MIKELLYPDCVVAQVKVDTWQQAISTGVRLLINRGMVTAEYEAAIFTSFETFGTYMVIAPGIVLSHARPESGVISPGLSVINLAQPIVFNHPVHDPVYLVITLAATDSDAHLDALRTIMTLLMDDDMKQRLCTSTDSQELFELFT